MIKVKVSLSIGFANGTHREVLEFEDGTPEDEIDEAVFEWAHNYIDYGWSYTDDC